MGFLTSYNRKIFLIEHSHQIESRLNDITAQKLRLTDAITELSGQIGDLGNTDSPSVKKLEAKRAELENLEKKMDIQMQKYQTKLQATQTEMQSLDGMLQQSIQKSFTYQVGGR